MAKPRQPVISDTSLAQPVRFNADIKLAAEIEDVASICEADMSAVIRAALRLGLPILRQTPGLCPLLQARVLRESL